MRGPGRGSSWCQDPAALSRVPPRNRKKSSVVGALAGFGAAGRARSCRAPSELMKSLNFISKCSGKPLAVLSRGMTWSDLHFRRLFWESVDLKGGERWAGEEGGT